MLEGIEILSQNVVETGGCPQFICIIMTVLMAIVSCFFIHLCIKQDGAGTCGMLIILAVLAGMSYGAWDSYMDKEKYTEYKVTISDNVSFKEFNDKYEVVDQDGTIYTIREKTPDNSK